MSASDSTTSPHPHAILDDPDAFAERAARLRAERSGFPDLDRPLASLLDALVWFFKVPTETLDIEATATARRPMGDVLREARAVGDEELERAREALPAFEAGISAARASDTPEVSFDSADPEQDRIAGALISYLVTTDLATVRTEELPDERYRYHIAIDWPRLDTFAGRLGLPPVGPGA